MGSAAHQTAEQYLVDQLTALGLQTELQETTSLRQPVEYGQPDIVVGGRVRNVVARLPGSDSTHSILLSATYDAMPTTPGAADNGAGVATVLETVRALKAGPPLTNDVIILLGDADTNGLIGEAAFASQHPWANDVGLVVSFGAMGNDGPTFPVSTSLESGRLIGALIASPHPLVCTCAPEVARATGTGGGALEYIQRGATTLMLASVAGRQANHTSLDNLQNFDIRGLQQTGEYTLATVRTFGNEDLKLIRAPDQVAFNLLPDRVVGYPGSWAGALAAVTVLALSVVLVAGVLRRQLTFRGVLLSALIFPLLILVSVVLTTIGWWTIRSANSNHDVFIAGTFGSRGISLDSSR